MLRRRETQIALGAVAALAFLLWAFTRDHRGPEWLAKNYGITEAYADDVMTPDGRTIHASVVPVTLPDGTTAQLIVPQRRTDRSLYMRDHEGTLMPVRLAERPVQRETFVRSGPTVVERKPVVKKKRSWEKEALIIGGSAGAGAAIGGLAGGKKGAGIGAITGGVAGLIYDLATRG